MPLFTIFPALIVVILLTMLLGAAVTTLTLPQYFRQPATWGYLKAIFLLHENTTLPGVFAHNPNTHLVNGSLWTLFYEFVYYLLICLLGLAGLLRRRWFPVLLFVLAYLCIATASFSARQPRGSTIICCTFIFISASACSAGCIRILSR